MFYAKDVRNDRVFAFLNQQARDAAVFGNVEPLTCINKRDARELMKNYIICSYASRNLEEFVAAVSLAREIREENLVEWYMRLV